MSDLPDPHGCPHCGHAGLAERWGETICGMCGAPRRHAEPGCPVRNIFGDIVGPTGFDRFVAQATRIMESAQARCESVIDDTARERRVHDGGPREVR